MTVISFSEVSKFINQIIERSAFRPRRKHPERILFSETPLLREHQFVIGILGFSTYPYVAKYINGINVIPLKIKLENYTAKIELTRSY